MSNRPQRPYAPEQDETRNALLKPLHGLMAQEGLVSSDIREAEQLISRYKNNYEQIREELEKLYIGLVEFDPRQSKIANVYLGLLRVIRDQSLTSQTTAADEHGLKPLPIPLQPGTEAREPDSPIAPEAKERMIGLLNDFRSEAKELLADTFSFHDRFSQVEDLIGKQADWNTLRHASKTAREQARSILWHLERFDDAVETQYRREIALRSSIEILKNHLKTALAEDQDQGLRLWYQTYAFCLSEWALERCALLVDKSIGLPDLISLAYSAASQKLVEGRYEATEDATEIDEMLKHLIDKLQTEQVM